MVQFSRDMEHLYSAGYDGSIRRWLLSTGEYQRSLVRNGWGVSVFEIDEERDMLAYGTADGGNVCRELFRPDGVIAFWR